MSNAEEIKEISVAEIEQMVKVFARTCPHLPALDPHLTALDPHLTALDPHLTART